MSSSIELSTTFLLQNIILIMRESKERSPLWYILPLVFSIFGAITAFLILRKDDPTKAKNCLWIGICLLAFYLAYYVVFSFMIETFEFS